MRDLSRPRKLHDLSRGCAATRRCITLRSRPGAGGRCAIGANSASESHSGVSRAARRGRERARARMRDVSHPLDVSRVPPPRRRPAVALPPVSVPRAAPQLCVRARGELCRLPQCRAVLPDLSPAERGGGYAENRHGAVPRCIPWIQPGTRTGGASESRILRVVPRRARLRCVPLRRWRWIPVQPAWPRFQRGPGPIQEPIGLHRVSRSRDPGLARSPGSRGCRGRPGCPGNQGAASAALRLPRPPGPPGPP